MSKTIVRIPIKLMVFDTETGEMVDSSSSRLKSKVSKLSAILLSKYDKNTHRFECLITYSKKNDCWNRFTFTSTAGLIEGLVPCTESELLKELKSCGFIDADCLPVR